MDTKQFIAEALNPRPRYSPIKCLLGVGLPAAFIAACGVYWYIAQHLTQTTQVVSSFMARTVSKTPFQYTAAITGAKISDCDLVANSPVGWAFDGLWRETDFSFLDDTTPNSSRPTGLQSFGVWQWKISPTDSQARLSIQHKCGDKIVLSIIGPFKF